VGALLGGATQKQLDVFTAYGIPLGQAFQLQDDMLGLFGNAEKLGKPVDSDLKEGKRTLLILKALEKASKKERAELLAALGNKDVTPAQVDRVREIVKSTGSFDYSKALAARLAAEARDAVAKSKFEKDGKDYLLGIADYLINREV